MGTVNNTNNTNVTNNTNITNHDEPAADAGKVNISPVRKTKYDIHERIFNFVVRVIKMNNSLPRNTSNSIIGQQLLRCATSIGANDQEADGVSTKKDFIHCYTIVRKETKETVFWLRLIAETNPLLAAKMGPIIQEGQELTAIISSIINNARFKQESAAP